MPDRLTALDATFLELEEADDSAHMHIGAILVFDPLPDGGVPSLERVAEHLHRRLGALSRYRQRLSERHTGGLRWPAWEEVPGFETRDHLRREALPHPGDEATLRDWAGEFFSTRLDRSRPLWETVVLEGLEGGRWALASKTHHCMVDGVGSVDVGDLLLDTEAQPGDDPEQSPLPPPGPAHDEDDVSLWLQPPRLALRAARTGVDAALHPSKVAEALKRSRAAVELLVRDELSAAPPSSINDPIGAHRRYGVVRADLAEIKEIKRQLGGTVNDVVLAVVTAGLRRLLLARGEEPPERGLRAMVPVNVRQASEHLSLGNKVSSLFVELPVAEPDALLRYAKAFERAERHKAGTQATGTATIMELTALAPPVLHATIARALYATRLFNVTVTNVPGRQQTLYAFGAPLREVWPLVPLAAEHAVGIAIVSYDGHVIFGVNADRDGTPDLDEFLAGMEEGLEQLNRAAAASRATGAPA
jgi:WS/DGAT/MGAT family acyltransferase